MAFLGSAVSGARADDFDAFESGRRAYQQQEYETAARRFEVLVGGQVPKLQSRPLILESRKYLGASYLFLGRVKEAEAQFELLIRMDNTYQVDPLAFPSDVVSAFERVRDRTNRILEEAARQRTEQEEAQRREETKKLVESQQRKARIRDLATSEYVETHNSRLIALIPFGIGQFQNGHDSLGTALAISEGILAVTSISTFFLHESLRNETPSPSDRADAENLRDGFKLTNWISTVLLGVLAVIGIVDAEVRFVPVEREVRKKALPKELDQEFQVSVSPGGFAVRF